MEASTQHRPVDISSLDFDEKRDSFFPLLHNLGNYDHGEVNGMQQSCGPAKPRWKGISLQNFTSPLVSSIATAIAMLFLWLLVEKHRAVRVPQNYIYDPKYSDELQLDTVTCGDSLTEAMARGCTFDPLADMWLPAECSRAYTSEYLGEYVDKYNNGTPWRYWADAERKHEIFNRSLYVDGTVYYSITKDHIIHCGLTLMRFADAIGTGARVGRMGSFEEHIKHCAGELMEYALRTDDEFSGGTMVGMGFC